MTQHPYIAVCTAIRNRLTDTSEIWGQQVGEVPLATWTKPYVQMYLISGMDTNFQVVQDAEFEIGVKVVTDNDSGGMDGALNGAARLSALLDDQGVQDRPTAALYGGSDWEIATSTQGRMIHSVEMFSQSVPVYHEGWVFSFVLGRL